MGIRGAFYGFVSHLLEPQHYRVQLLRLKCEAYSTLSDTDENSDAENRLKERMLADGVPPPKQEVLSPASLYLTAIIE